MQLNERIVEKAEIIRDSAVPKGILARVWYPIMRFGVKNANKRKYGRPVAETVLNDSAVQHKLKTRTLFGNQEHPELSQIKLDWKETSHVISEFKLDENTFYAAFDILPSEPGKFIHGLLEAGCLVGVSTRADGELEECLDEDGSSYHNVIPGSYKFQTVDFTGDPSTPNALPEKIISSVKTRHEAKTLDNKTAVALLEYANTPEARQLMESILKEDHHSCTCTPTADGKSVISCACGPHTPIKEVKEVKVNLPKVGSFVKVNEKSGVIAHFFPRTKKVIVQFTDGKETVKLEECKLVEDAVGSNADLTAQRMFGKPYVNLSFEQKEQVLDASGDQSEPQFKGEEPPIVPDIQQIPPATSEAPTKGFYKDGKGELLFVNPTADGNVTVTRQDGTDTPMSVAEFNALRAIKNEAITRKSLVSNAVEAKEYFEMSKEIREANSIVKAAEAVINEAVLEPKIDEARVEQYLEDNWSSFSDSKEAINNLISTFKINEVQALDSVEKCFKSGRIQLKSPVTVETIKEHYVTDVITSAQKIAELKKVIEALQEENKSYLGIEERAGTQAETITILNKQVETLTKSFNESQVTVESQVKTIQSLSETVKELKKSNSLNVSHINESEKYSTKLQEDLKVATTAVRAQSTTIESLTTQIKALKESHKRDLIKIYVESRISGLGLKLPKNTLALLESCNTVEEVNALIRQTQDAIREGITHSVNISEIKIADSGVQPTNSLQQKIDSQVEKALKNFGI